MTIRNKILLYFSATSIALVGIAFFIIYWLFSGYREEDFQQRQKEKIITTLHFISEIEKDEKGLAEAIDRLTINSLLDEKLLIFDNTQKLIYASLDDVPIGYSDKLLNRLNEDNVWIEQKDELYDVVAIYFKSGEKSYYGISKAYDKFGYTKLSFLKKLLITAFMAFAVIVTLISISMANRISKPISELTSQLGHYKIGEKPQKNKIQTNTYEIDFLNTKFNELLYRMNNAYAFQKNAIHHISHELKTPISVLVSNFEKMENETDLTKLKLLIQSQKEDTKSLSEIINALLEIAKTESGTVLKQDQIRIDELIFDVAEELKTIYPEFNFYIDYTSQTENENQLIITANARLIKSALINLMQNCVHYSNENKAKIDIETNKNGIELIFENKGKPISNEENKFLFQHFFRGKNSQGKRGFGLGLVFVHKIIDLHSGTISYSSPDNSSNVFTLNFNNS